MDIIDKLKAIADAIRDRTGGTDTMQLDEMPSAIASIKVKGDLELTITENGTYTPPEGKAYSSVIAKVPLKKEITLEVDKNGTYTPPEGNTYSSVAVNVPLKKEIALELDKNGTYTPPEGNTYSSVIAKIPLKKEIALEVDKNGTYTPPEESTYSSVEVNVPFKEETTLTVDENGTYTPLDGKVYSSVVVNVSSTVVADEYCIAVGEELPISYSGSSPTVVCPTCLSYQIDGGIILFTGVSPGAGVIYLYQNDILVGQYIVAVTSNSVVTGSYSVTVGYEFQITYPNGVTPTTVICPACVTYLEDSDLIVTAKSVGTGTIYLYKNDILIGRYSITVAAVETGNYSKKLGDEFGITYEGSSPTVECPSFLTYRDDGGEVMFTAKNVGEGTIKLYRGNMLIGQYSITVTANVDSNSYNIKVGDTFEIDYPSELDITVEHPSCVSKYVDSGSVLFTGVSAGTGTIYIRVSDTIIGQYSVTVVENVCTHTWNDGVVTTDATCKFTGLMTYTCTKCGQTKTETIAKLPHTEGDPVWSNANEMDCQTYAHYKVYCTVCKELIREYDDDGVVGEHTYTGGDCTTPGTCTKCGATNSAPGHSWSGWTTTLKPGCDNDGKQERTCSVCKKTETQGIEALGHDFTYTEGKAATCTEAGYKAYNTCKICGDIVGGGRIDPLGHEYTSTVTPPTCTDYGYTTHTCSRCGHSYRDTETDPNGHSYPGGWSVVIQATCEKAGLETRTCDECGYTEDRTIQATGHAYSSTVIDATCESGGYTTHTCVNCGDHYTSDETDPNGHDYSGGWTVVKDATCTEEGREERRCMSCGKTESATIPTIDHDYEAIEDSSQSSGYVGVCRVCGDTLEDYSP